jgi:hypothetical protein
MYMYVHVYMYVCMRECMYVRIDILIIDVELTVPQKQYYRAIYEQNTAFLYKGIYVYEYICMCVDIYKYTHRHVYI